MESSIPQKGSRPIKAYISLVKPGILFGNAITAAGGFALAARGHIDFRLFLATLAGLCLIMASGCAFNNYIDREADQKMKRTQNRPLATGFLSVRNALIFATCLGITGTLLLAYINFLTAGIALIGFIVYVCMYTFSKYRTTQGTLIGSVAGAVPPVVGYCAVSNHLDSGALILFTMIAFWQMPHFFAIAIYRLDEYAAASIPVLPLKKGIPKTKTYMIIYVAAFIISSLLLPFFGLIGKGYTLVAAILGFAWLILAVMGLTSTQDKLWARKMFIMSLIVVTGLCISIPCSV